jgi:hexosaminidase
MKATWTLSAIMMSLSLIACSPADVGSSSSSAAAKVQPSPQVSHWQQQSLQQFADNLIIKYRVVTNIPAQACPEDAKEDDRCFIAEIDFTSLEDMPLSGWAIYFSQIRPVLTVLNDEFHIERLQGDLHRITPSVNFSGFKALKTKTLRFRGELWQLSETDAMPNYYILARDVNGIELAPPQC